jgi:hypothetical protein
LLVGSIYPVNEPAPPFFYAACGSSFSGAGCESARKAHHSNAKLVSVPITVIHSGGCTSHWEIQIPPYWHGVTHLQVLPFREDLPGAGNAVIVDPVVTVSIAAPVAHLHQPRPKLLPVARRW